MFTPMFEESCCELEVFGKIGRHHVDATAGCDDVARRLDHIKEAEDVLDESVLVPCAAFVQCDPDAGWSHC